MKILSKIRLLKLIFSSSVFLLVLLSLFRVTSNHIGKVDRAEIFLREHRNSFIKSDERVTSSALGKLARRDFSEIASKDFGTGKENWFRRDYNNKKIPYISRLFVIKRSIFFDRSKPTTELISFRFYYLPFRGFSNLLLVWLISVAALIPALIFSEKKSYNRNEKELIAQRDAAIVKTTQMMSHDVRKPFSMIKGLLSIIENSKTLSESRGIVQKFSPEITKAISAVDEMIADILEVGSHGDLVTTTARPSKLIEDSLADVFQFQENSDINLFYSLNHTILIEVNSLKVKRILTNIIANASQAMKSKGDIWISTQNISNKGKINFVEFKIRNSGSYIPDDEIHSLFEDFYTKGKSSGTGLGLTIAKKIVEDHGGEIKCLSSRAEGVAFVFTLPASNDFERTDKIKSPNFNNSHDFAAGKKLSQPTDPESLEIESLLTESLKRREIPLKILVADDQAIYFEDLDSYFSSNPNLDPLIQIFHADSPEKTISIATDLMPDIILMDVDFLNKNISGFELTAILRKSGFKCKICIHTDQGVFELQQKVIESGANLLIPKPISNAQIMRLIYSTATDSPSSDLRNSNIHKRKVAILDDNILFLESWKSNDEFEFVRFLSPEDLFASIKASEMTISQLACVVTDFHFGDSFSSFDGFSFAKRFRAMGYSNPIFLSSDGVFDANSLPTEIEKVVSKVPKEAWAVIQSRL